MFMRRKSGKVHHFTFWNYLFPKYLSEPYLRFLRKILVDYTCHKPLVTLISTRMSAWICWRHNKRNAHILPCLSLQVKWVMEFQTESLTIDDWTMPRLMAISVYSMHVMGWRVYIPFPYFLCMGFTLPLNSVENIIETPRFSRSRANCRSRCIRVELQWFMSTYG